MKLPELYDKKKIDFNNLLFNDKAIWTLLIPLIAEQILNSLMGMADTMMLSRWSAVAMSAASLVDSLNTLLIQVFNALAVGASIVCSQYIGHKDNRNANKAACQVTLTMAAISVTITAICLIFARPILTIVFGAIEDEVMKDCLIYFLITASSYPFMALGNAASALFRAGGESRFPMMVAMSTNGLNIVGNALLIFGFRFGIMGAAISTLVSRILYMLILYGALRRPKQIIVIRDYRILPDWDMIQRILGIGIPSGVENGMFQFGKLMIQSSVATLGTVAISANAMTIILESLNGIAGVGVGLGLMTIAGQAMGAGRIEETKYYIVKLDKIAGILVAGSCLVVLVLSYPICLIAGMSSEAIKLTMGMIIFVTITKPLFWVLSFTTPNGLRAAGDVKYTMIVSTMSMWFCRVLSAVILIRVFGVGPIAVWIGMAIDWGVRALIFSHRFFTGKWIKRVID